MTHVDLFNCAYFHLLFFGLGFIRTTQKSNHYSFQRLFGDVLLVDSRSAFSSRVSHLFLEMKHVCQTTSEVGRTYDIKGGRQKDFTRTCRFHNLELFYKNKFEGKNLSLYLSVEQLCEHLSPECFSMTFFI